jgi:putative selenium metabolism protein SsnA
MSRASTSGKSEGGAMDIITQTAGSAHESPMSSASRYIVGNGVVTDGMEVFFERGAILIAGDRIEEIGDVEEIRGRGDHFIDVKGRLILPGFLNPHQHLYSTLATGLSPVGEAGSFTRLLESLWWRLDSVLDEEAVYTSALIGIIESIKHGATMIFDHHASMSYVRGSLSAIEKAFDLAGIKGTLCFETSDRPGEEAAALHIEENLDFWEKHRESPALLGLLGLHANFTLSDNTLKRIRSVKPENLPIHIHCGEDRADFDFCTDLGYRGPVDRLERFDLLDSHSILAHAIHLSSEDLRIIEEIDPLVVTNPESNANNQVGAMNRERITRYLLGTDGMSPDLVKTLRSHYLLGRGRKESLEELGNAFFRHKAACQQRFFPETGLLLPGRMADIAVLDYIPLTPVSPATTLAHLLFGAESGRAYMTISNGNILYRDGKILFADEERIIQEAKAVARSLHERYYG